MAVRVARTLKDIALGEARLAALGFVFAPGYFYQHEGCMVIGDKDGVMWCRVIREPKPALWVQHLQGRRAAWQPLIREMCREAFRRGFEDLPTYRTMDPAKPMHAKFATLDNQLGETTFHKLHKVRDDGLRVYATTPREILAALDRLAVKAS